jgi:hypothetical protein
MPKTLDDIFKEEEAILDRRIGERRERERAWNRSPEGIASMERARQRQIEREALEVDEPEVNEDEDEDEDDAENDDAL